MSLPDSPVYPEAKELAQSWQATVERDLKGADFNKRLVTQTYDGISIQPLYGLDPETPDENAGGMPGTFPHTRGNSTLSTSRFGWDILQSYNLGEDNLNQSILTDLQKGVSSVHLVAGTEKPTFEQVKGALEGVHLNMASVFFDGGAYSKHANEILSQLIKEHSEEAQGSFMQDPIGQLASTNDLDDNSLSTLGKLAKSNNQNYPKMQTASVSTEVYHAAGASDAQCLAFAMSTAVAYLRSMEDAGLNIKESAKQIGFHLALDARFFAGIAAIRACRTLWSKITEACGAAAGAWIRVHPARRILTKRDPWVNQLRNTATTFAGSVAGADAITTLPWDATLRPADAFGRRVARNTQLVMSKESHLSRVIDPAGGSYFIEELTQKLCEKAWGIFQEVEKQGGLAEALQSGWVQAQIDKVYASRTKNLAKRKQAITGVNQFPDLHEETIAPQLPSSSKQGLVARPDAEAFEALRDASDSQLSKHGKRPTAFLVNLGTIAEHTARATFAANLLASGGIDQVPGTGGTDHTELCESFKAAQSQVAVICGSDKLYAEHAAPLAQSLKAAGAKWIIVAGRPGDNESQLREAGVQDFVYLGCNALESLGNLWTQWEAQS